MVPTFTTSILTALGVTLGLTIIGLLLVVLVDCLDNWFGED